MKKASIVVAVVMFCGFAVGDSISNMAQIVGRDITQDMCMAMPTGYGFSNWEKATLAVLRAIRTGDATNFFANATIEMLNREFAVSPTNSIPENFSQAFAQTSAEFSRYRVTSYEIRTNTSDLVGLDINLMLRRGTSTNDILETINFSLIRTNDVWKVDGL